ncbi:MAG: S24/S26 family peptidase [Anaerolineae bacterium]|jgi:hypothetical protein
MDSVDCQRADFCRLSEEILERGSALRFQASGDSMRPFIRSGDILVVEPAEARGVRAGDVVLVRQGERLLVHRVVAAPLDSADALTVKGDAHLMPDPPLRRDQVLGKVTAVQRAGTDVAVCRGLPGLVARLLWGRPPYVGARAYRLFARGRRGVLRVARSLCSSEVC